MKTFLSISYLLIVGLLCRAQSPEAVSAYIQKYKDIAIQEMVRCKIPASVTLAQGLHESSCGKSPLSCTANNHFGIKCKEDWEGDRFYHDDDQPHECFRSYNDAADSYKDHSTFLSTRPRYAQLFQLPITDYKSWAWGLKSAGYATNPNYAPIIINLIEDYKLYEYDQQALAIIADSSRQKTGTDYTEQINPVSVISPIPETLALPAKKDAVAITSTHPPRETFLFHNIKTAHANGEESPLAVAVEFDTDYRLIMEYNDLKEGERFSPGENIYLQPKRNKGTEPRYQVSDGESMRDVAQRFAVKLDELYLRNQMKPNDQVMPGEILYLQDKRDFPPITISYSEFLKFYSSRNLKSLPASNELAVASTNNEPGIIESRETNGNPLSSGESRQVSQGTVGGDKRYTVGSMDTLYSIAKKYNVTVEELKDWNGLESFNLAVGQSLIVQK